MNIPTGTSPLVTATLYPPSCPTSRYEGSLYEDSHNFDTSLYQPSAVQGHGPPPLSEGSLQRTMGPIRPGDYDPPASRPPHEGPLPSLPTPLADKCQKQEQKAQGTLVTTPLELEHSRNGPPPPVSIGLSLSGPLLFGPPLPDDLIRQDVPMTTLISSAVSRSSEDALSRVLSKLRHLDLTGRVVSECAVMKAHGGYCDIFIGSLSPVLSSHSGKIKVAVKRLRVYLHNDQALARLFVKEVHIWSKLDHPNILSFKGYMIENGYPSLVSEWVENGTVIEFLKVNPRAGIEAILLGVAKGLGYLHDQGVVHSDLKADNVLISRLGHPLICDFGISSMIISSHTLPLSTTHNGSVRGTTRYMSIELFGIGSDTDPKHTKASDIWAYGITIYEIITKQRPYAHIKADQRVILAIIRGELPSRPVYNEQLPALEDIWGICEDCWKADPEDRIIISKIILRMEQCSGSTSSVLQRTLSSTRETIPPLQISHEHDYRTHETPINGSLKLFDPAVDPVSEARPSASGPVVNTDTGTTARCTRVLGPKAESEPNSFSNEIKAFSNGILKNASQIKSFSNELLKNASQIDSSLSDEIESFSNKILKKANNIRLDLSSPTHAPLTPSSSGNRSGYNERLIPVHKDYLSQVASEYPAVSKAVKTCNKIRKIVFE